MRRAYSTCGCPEHKIFVGALLSAPFFCVALSRGVSLANGNVRCADVPGAELPFADRFALCLWRFRVAAPRVVIGQNLESPGNQHDLQATRTR